jgi:hypothetical protein
VIVRIKISSLPVRFAGWFGATGCCDAVIAILLAHKNSVGKRHWFIVPAQVLI